MTRLMASSSKVTRRCEHCGRAFWLLNGLQGGQRIDTEASDDGVIRVEEKHVRAAVPNVPGEMVTSYVLLPADVAARAREKGELLHHFHRCAVQAQPEEGPVTPWRPYAREGA